MFRYKNATKRKKKLTPPTGQGGMSIVKVGEVNPLGWAKGVTGGMLEPQVDGKCIILDELECPVPLGKYWDFFGSYTPAIYTGPGMPAGILLIRREATPGWGGYVTAFPFNAYRLSRLAPDAFKALCATETIQALSILTDTSGGVPMVYGMQVGTLPDKLAKRLQSLWMAYSNDDTYVDAYYSTRAAWTLDDLWLQAEKF